MKAAVLRSGKIVVDNIESPKPGEGEVLVKTLACGICGSDLHTLNHVVLSFELNRAALCVLTFVTRLPRQLLLCYFQRIGHFPKQLFQLTVRVIGRCCWLPTVREINPDNC